MRSQAAQRPPAQRAVLALNKTDAAEALRVSVDFFDENIASELKWMGHRDIQTTQRYSDYAPSPHEAQLVAAAFSRRDPGRAPASAMDPSTYRDASPGREAVVLERVPD